MTFKGSPSSFIPCREVFSVPVVPIENDGIGSHLNLTAQQKN